MITLKYLAALIGRFRAAQAGAAAVEFALVLPIMLILYIGANEASLLITIDRKVQLVSGTVGDLVARSKDQITFAELSDYVKVSSGLLSPYSATDMTQIVSQVQVLNGVAKVVWSRGFQSQAAQSALNRAPGSVYEPFPASMVAIAEGQHVIVAETKMAVQPLYGIVIATPITLYRENFYMPRFEAPITLK